MNLLKTYLVGIAEKPVYKTAFVLTTNNHTITPEEMVEFMWQQNVEKVTIDTKHFGEINPDEFELPEDVHGVFTSLLFDEIGNGNTIPIHVENEISAINKKFKDKLQKKSKGPDKKPIPNL